MVSVRVFCLGVTSRQPLVNADALPALRRSTSLNAPPLPHHARGGGAVVGVASAPLGPPVMVRAEGARAEHAPLDGLGSAPREQLLRVDHLQRVGPLAQAHDAMHQRAALALAVKNLRRVRLDVLAQFAVEVVDASLAAGVERVASGLNA